MKHTTNANMFAKAHSKTNAYPKPLSFYSHVP